jgi:hypothetical protein
MEPTTTVYFVSREGPDAPDEIRSALGLRQEHVRVLGLAAFPRPGLLDQGTMVVVDLRRSPHDLEPPAADLTVRTQFTVVLHDDESIPAQWINFLRLRRVRLVTAERGSHSIYHRLAKALELRLCGFCEELTAALVAENQIALGGLEEVVETLLSDPWGIRSPSDLAAALGTSVQELQARCTHLGLRRLEHLITLIRWLGFEHLTGPAGIM